MIICFDLNLFDFTAKEFWNYVEIIEGRFDGNVWVLEHDNGVIFSSHRHLSDEDPILRARNGSILPGGKTKDLGIPRDWDDNWKEYRSLRDWAWSTVCWTRDSSARTILGEYPDVVKTIGQWSLELDGPSAQVLELVERIKPHADDVEDMYCEKGRVQLLFG